MSFRFKSEWRCRTSRKHRQGRSQRRETKIIVQTSVSPHFQLLR